MLKKFVMLSVVALAVGTFLTSAAEAKTYEVRYNPTELESVNGTHKVYQRIQNVAESLCRDEFRGKRFVQSRGEYRACVNSVTGELVVKTKGRALKELHAGKPDPKIYAANR